MITAPYFSIYIPIYHILRNISEVGYAYVKHVPITPCNGGNLLEFAQKFALFLMAVKELPA